MPTPNCQNEEKSKWGIKTNLFGVLEAGREQSCYLTLAILGLQKRASITMAA